MFGFTGIPLPQRLQKMYGTRIGSLGADIRTELLRIKRGAALAAMAWLTRATPDVVRGGPARVWSYLPL
ncbi:hypothetical protein AMK18_07920 [Streptomyces sp. CB01249]|uniref:hypothetical protein n=1 Tax=Streptomyces sp. CB01249 TaxID=1703929 RepID=UPI00093DACD0|nr:hypothetical protein [Streptomyces sp. CB01249]OKJ05084.1 hypothetical protein AMK18_07920 [Streptomyces sp. CB01249]